MKRTVPSLLVALLLLPAARADVIHVPGDHADARSALVAAATDHVFVDHSFPPTQVM